MVWGNVSCLVVLCFTAVGASLYPEFPSVFISESELITAASAKVQTDVQMSPAEVAFLLRYLNESSSFFEFGCGGSTKVVASFGPQNLRVTSVDSSKEWIEKVLEDETCKAKVANGTMLIRHVDIGPVGPYGHPAQTVQDSRGGWYVYSRAISTIGGEYDTVLVDGRFRVACVLSTILAQPSAKVLVHDFLEPSHYPHYRPLLDVAEVVQRVETLVELKRRPNASRADLLRMYAAYMFVEA